MLIADGAGFGMKKSPADPAERSYNQAVRTLVPREALLFSGSGSIALQLLDCDCLWPEI